MKLEAMTMQDVFNPEWYAKQVDAVYDMTVDTMEPYFLDENARENMKTMMNANRDLQKAAIRSGTEYWNKLKTMA